MKISELEKGKELNIEVKYGDEVMKHTGVVAEVFDGSVLIEAIRSEEGKLLDFYSSNLSIDVYVPVEGERPLMFKGVTIRCVSYKKTPYHQILTEKNATAYNRRDSVRVYVGVKGKARFSSANEAMDVIVKDASCTGFAVVVEEEIDNTVGGMVRVVFEDDKTRFDLTGNVVRSYTLDNGKTVYGCLLDRPNGALQRYVSAKQRQEMSRRSGTGNNLNG